MNNIFRKYKNKRRVNAINKILYKLFIISLILILKKRVFKRRGEISIKVVNISFNFI